MDREEVEFTKIPQARLVSPLETWLRRKGCGLDD
jgi:hypothetical protein